MFEFGFDQKHSNRFEYSLKLVWLFKQEILIKIIMSSVRAKKKDWNWMDFNEGESMKPKSEWFKSLALKMNFRKKFVFDKTAFNLLDRMILQD